MRSRDSRKAQSGFSVKVGRSFTNVLLNDEQLQFQRVQQQCVPMVQQQQLVLQLVQQELHVQLLVQQQLLPKLLHDQHLLMWNKQILLIQILVK